MADMTSYPTNALKDALKRLIKSTFLPEAARYLEAHSAAINADLGEIVLAEIPAFSESRNPDILPELALHGPEHTDEMVRLLKGGAVGDFEFVRKHARRRVFAHYPPI